jgi:hypothetical protein
VSETIFIQFVRCHNRSSRHEAALASAFTNLALHHIQLLFTHTCEQDIQDARLTIQDAQQTFELWLKAAPLFGPTEVTSDPSHFWIVVKPTSPRVKVSPVPPIEIGYDC